MLEFAKRRWFLLSLLALITSGLVIGSQSAPVSVEKFKHLVPTQPLTAFVLLLMAFSLNSQQLKSSFRAPAPVVWACLVNFGLLPILGVFLMRFQLTPDFRIGLMIAASTPCTLAAASVWTRKARGNDAVSLLTTLVTNTACFALTPFWLNYGTSQSASLDAGELTKRLVLVVLLPTLFGQSMRLSKTAASFATQKKTAIGVVAQSCILLLVFLSALGGGVQLQKADMGTQLTAVILVWMSCVVMHVVALGVAWFGGGFFGFDRRDRIAAAFAGSQKTLPIGVYLATDPAVFGGAGVVGGLSVPFAVFPMLMFHASQLFIDTIVADRLAQESAKAESSPDTAT
ncbi:MAG: bile acid:sodium symporter [Planctomycetota bacterium]|nr:bile acid:sodium symporter [Planctomycetota bacterium]